MKLAQLSLFLENKQSHLKTPCDALAAAGVNILTLQLADTRQFGILRLIVRDWQKAKEVLEQAGCVVKVTDVVAIEVPNLPGGLAGLLGIIDELGINIEYMYAFTFGRGDRAVMIFRFTDADAAIASLQTRGVNVVGGVELYERAAGA